MPEITYHEFRPGKWVKLVDGKIVGPATAAEVAAWKQEKAAPTRIWEDVVKVAKPPAAKAKSSARKEPDQPIIWQDVVKQTKPSIKAEGPPELRPRKEDTDAVAQAEIWQDLVKQVRKPHPKAEQKPAKAMPVLPQQGPEADRKQATKAAVPAKPAPSRKKGPTAKAKPKPTERRAPAKKASAGEPPPALSAAGPKPDTKGVGKARVAPKAVSVRKAKAPGKGRQPAAKEMLPAKLLDKIEEDKGVPAPTEAVATPPEIPSIASALERERVSPKPRGAPSAASRRIAERAKATSAQERPNQLYLWIAAGQTDDLIATVRTGLARYQERFSQPAEVVLCHSADLPALEGAKLPVDLREGKSIAPRNFWIGLK